MDLEHKQSLELRVGLWQSFSWRCELKPPAWWDHPGRSMLCGRAKRPSQKAVCPLLAQNDYPGSAAQFQPPSSNTDVIAWGGFCLLSRFLGFCDAESGWQEAGGRQEVYELGLGEIVLKSLGRDTFKSSCGVCGKVDWRRKKRGFIMCCCENPFCGV